MLDQFLDTIRKQRLSPFTESAAPESLDKKKSAFKTKEAKAVQTRVLERISRRFHFAATARLLTLLETSSPEEIKQRQSFFQSLPTIGGHFLETMKEPKPYWKPPYNIIIATEDEHAYLDFRRRAIPVMLVQSAHDLRELEGYDLVQVVGADTYREALEQLPQTVFVEKDEAYLEHYLVMLSAWKENLQVLENVQLPPLLQNRIKLENLVPLLGLLERHDQKIDEEMLQHACKKINQRLNEHLQGLTLSGEALITAMSKGIYPEDVRRVIAESMQQSGLPAMLFTMAIPVAPDLEALQNYTKDQGNEQSTTFVRKLKQHALALRSIPEELKRIEECLLLADFIAGTSPFLQGHYPQLSEQVRIQHARNLFLQKPEPISFHLTAEDRCSMLTGANSGGKTTLLEHLLQIIVFHHLGLPVDGTVELPLFTEIYYFAKTKGGMSKGAFETLLNQMASVTPGKQTLLLADEIEAVTEPGVAAKIICATAAYFIEHGCWMIIATHLGQEISKQLPPHARIDGIEAKGLNEQMELIVDHNPVLGRLAHSTPELIVEKMARTTNSRYIAYVYDLMKVNGQS